MDIRGGADAARSVCDGRASGDAMIRAREKDNKK